VEPRSPEHADVWNLGRAESWNSGDGKFKNMLKVWFGSHERGNSRTSEKQSQSCCPKKSGFSVWTNGRLVNVWDVKDVHVCVHIRNILWAQGCFRNVKVPSSSYKGGEGTCERGHYSWKFVLSVGGSQSLTVLLLLRYCSWTCLLPRLSFMFGDPIWLFGYPQQNSPPSALPPHPPNMKQESEDEPFIVLFQHTAW
jgi:hypothetical protein